MREIQFRAWDKKERTIKNIDLYWFEENTVRNIEDTESVQWDMNNFIIMQYTWLKDNNWKEIYEGDLIKIWLWDDDYGLKVIEFDRGIFWYKKALTTLHPLWCVLESIIEIKGNIYENPDLITN